MVEKKFILNADDFGLSQAHNQAVLEGYINGFLSSTSLCANGAAYDNAVHDISHYIPSFVFFKQKMLFFNINPPFPLFLELIN